MVFGLQPTEDVTGGAWFTDGVLDEGLIHGLGEYVVYWVASKSWAVKTERVANPMAPDSSVEVGKKRKLVEQGFGEIKERGEGVEGTGKRHQSSRSKSSMTYLPFPPGYKNYPTLSEITSAINSAGVSQVELKQPVIQQLVDVLCFDGHLIKVPDGDTYRSVKKPGQLSQPDALGPNALTEAPCGVCPVFELCEEDGPINAANCEYFQDWLQLF